MGRFKLTTPPMVMLISLLQVVFYVTVKISRHQLKSFSGSWTLGKLLLEALHVSFPLKHW